MSLPSSAKISVHPDLEALSRAAAEDLTVIAAAAIADHGCCSLALSGGETPLSLFRLLAAEYATRVAWLQVEVFWVDERFVPSHDRSSNYGAARAAWLADSPLPRSNVHPIPTDLPSPDEAAARYERQLRAHFFTPWPRFDLVLLGLGADGHTASLFPGSPALAKDRRWVEATEAPVEPKPRITLTLPAINRAAHVRFLVAGARKAAALRAAVSSEPDLTACPASAVRPSAGDLIWWVDPAAAGQLDQEPPAGPQPSP